MKKAGSKQALRDCEIICFSLPPELAAQVKMEAAGRDVSLRNLFVEVWSIYKDKRPT